MNDGDMPVIHGSANPQIETRNSQRILREPELATRNPQPATHFAGARTRNSKRATRNAFYFPASSRDRSVAASTARIRVPRTPFSSMIASPRMVVPPGDVMRSFSSPGCFPVS